MKQAGGMRNCEPYNEVSKKTLNPYYLLQQDIAPFDDKEYKSLLFNFMLSLLLLFLSPLHL